MFNVTIEMCSLNKKSYVVNKNFRRLEMADGDIVPAGKTSFVRVGEHELAETGRKVAALSNQALDTLAEGLSSPDEKVRMDCAKTLIKLNIDISKIINEDALNRLISEFRFVGQVESPKNITPLVDFSKIQEV